MARAALFRRVAARFSRLGGATLCRVSFCRPRTEMSRRAGLEHALRASPLPWAASHMANAAKIEITDRIRLVSSLMGAGRFWYMPAAASVRDALATALWNSKNPTKDERLDDGSTDIDTLDALEYSLERNYKRFLKARNCTA